MIPLNPKLKAKYQRPITSSELRNDFVDRSYEVGGKDFVAAVEKWGVNERGDRLNLPHWYKEYCELIGDFRVAYTYTTGAAQVGKAQPLDAKILTPHGWKLMGDISLGDVVIAGDGTQSKVTGIYPQGIKDVYRVTLDDGTWTECCNEHLWLTQTAKDRYINKKDEPLKPHGCRQRDWTPLEDGSRPGTVKELSEIVKTLLVADASGNPRLTRGVSTKCNHSIPVISSSIDFLSRQLPLDPYLLGALLGNGGLSTSSNVRFSSQDEETIEQVRRSLPVGNEMIKCDGDNCDFKITCQARGYHNREEGCHPVLHSLRRLGLMGCKSYDKFIPDVYKFADRDSRIALVQGLLDTDGTVSKNGIIQFNSSSDRLINDFREVVLSLGGVVRAIGVKVPSYTYKGEKRQGATAYRLTIRLPSDINAFRLSRKLNRCVERKERNRRRYIKSVDYVGKKECQCILIDHPSHLYVTDNYIVTHNTLGHTLLLCYCLTEGGLNTLWAYDQERSLNIQVPSNFRPVIKAWMKIRGIKTKKDSGTQNNTLYQVRGATAQFVYVSTSKIRDKEEGKAAAGGIAVGVSRDILFKEERSQYPPGAGDPLNRRLDAGRLPSRPLRELGTPGSGNGIEAEIAQADYQFYPHYQCPYCGTEAPLNPKGCLLRLVGGKYLSISGRPIEWFTKDKEAYFGCSECEGELSREVRKTAWFRCLKTGIDLRDFLDSLPKTIPQARYKVGISLSPLLRIRETNAAQELINEGLATLNPEDWQQQGLGDPSESNYTGVTLEILKNAIALPIPRSTPTFTLAGIDQGRSEYWLWKCAYHLPVDWQSLPVAQVIDQAQRRVLFGGDVMKGELPNMLDGVDFGIIDNEPDISAAAELCDRTCLEMADQQASQLDAVKEGIVREGGNEHNCWKIRNEKFLKQVLHAFLMGKIHLPSDWDVWVGKPTERSPLVHLAAPSFDPSTGKWKRGKNHVDDLYYAAMFCEVAFYLHLVHGRKQSGFDMWSMISE